MCIRDSLEALRTKGVKSAKIVERAIKPVLVSIEIHGPETQADALNPVSYTHLDVYKRQVHTWPELNAVTLDLYVCNFSQDNSVAARAAFNRLIAAFAPQHVQRRALERGSPA